VQSSPEPPERAADTGTSSGREAVQRWRLVIRRTALPAGRAQREQLAEWDAALIASGLPVAGLDTPRAKPRYAIGAPLPAPVPGEAELIDIWLVERLPRWRVREALAPVLPDRHALVDLHDVWLGEAPLAGRVAASLYRAELPPPADAERLKSAAAELMASQTLPRERRKADTTVAYDLRPFLSAIEVTARGSGGAVIRMTLLHDPSRGIGRPDEALAALGDALGGQAPEPETLVREGLVLAEPTPPPPPAPRGPRRPPGPHPGGR
jgi:hypothetical protein